MAPDKETVANVQMVYRATKEEAKELKTTKEDEKRKKTAAKLQPALGTGGMRQAATSPSPVTVTKDKTELSKPARPASAKGAQSSSAKSKQVGRHDQAPAS